jgi:hypothetical protein
MSARPSAVEATLVPATRDLGDGFEVRRGRIRTSGLRR